MSSALRASPSRAGGRSRAARRFTREERRIEYDVLLTATWCLVAVGVIMVYSATSAPSLLQGGTGIGTIARFVGFAAVGLVLMRVLARRGLELALRLTTPLLIFSLVSLLAVRVPHVGIEVNGARRWLGAGPLQFQPSELAKLALILYCAQALDRWKTCTRSLRELRPVVLVVAVAILLVASQPDLGTAMVIAATVSAMLLAARIPWRNLAVLGGVGALVLVLVLIALPYARARLTSFVDPWSHAGTTGFQSVQGEIAIGSGGVVGRGLGQSVQKEFYLPEASTDFILAVIAEEVGVLGVCGLLFLYGLIAYAGLRAALWARTYYAGLIAVGVTTLIVFQALLNAFAVLGIAPLTGVPLPFVSYGSTNLIVVLAGMGLLLNVAAGADVSAAASDAEPRAGRRLYAVPDGRERQRERERRPRREDAAGSARQTRRAGEQTW